ncbi:GTP 3',8-cyclase MoaA [Primorskyibacter sp. S187A]|uniref:GTP 3',8-cyclase MoaA n=1 Tax=Primorskyibacter sp. S187A TaxID=3415130 RepID=UPI003C7AB0FB
MPFDASNSAPFVDSFGRAVRYLRLSVTDRCDLRCTYCMAEKMTFLPRREVLSVGEMLRLARVFVAHGTRKIRITGGEPLVRSDVMELFEGLAAWRASGNLDEITLTTNGTRLARYAEDLVRCGVRRVNVSLDTLDADRYRALTRIGTIQRVLDGIDAARAAGLHIRLNAVASRGAFEAEVDDLIRFAHGRGMDLAIIEEMPLGQTGCDRGQTCLSNASLRKDLSQRWTMTPARNASGGPAQVFRVAETGGTLGFISPMSCNFCAACNRVRLSCTGRLFTCLGEEGSVDLRDAAQRSDAAVIAAIREALWHKPERHSFDPATISTPNLERHMSALGG